MLIDPRLLELDQIDEWPFEFENEQDAILFKEQIQEWHKEYGHIYVTEVKDIHFFFRALSKKELKFAQEFYHDDYERTEYICKLCIIEPLVEDYSLEIYAGVPETLCRVILDESGFTDAQKIKIMIAKWEREMENIENQLPLVIKEAFQDLSLEEIESWPMARVTEYYVKAKWLLENLRGTPLVSASETE